VSQQLLLPTEKRSENLQHPFQVLGPLRSAGQKSGESAAPLSSVGVVTSDGEAYVTGQSAAPISSGW